MNKKLLTTLLASIVLLYGCSTPQKATPRPDRDLPDYVGVDGSINHEVRDERVVELWQKSEAERSNGQYENALTFLNEALEYAPEDAVLWSRGAEIYLTVRENGRAENYASKSNAFAREDSLALQYRNWLIIRHAREMRGDLLGARNAQQMVQKFQAAQPTSE